MKYTVERKVKATRLAPATRFLSYFVACASQIPVIVAVAMKQQWRACIKLPLCYLVGLMLATGCARLVVGYETDLGIGKRPQMSVFEARRSVSHALRQATLGYYYSLEEIQVTSEGFSFKNPTGEGGVPAGKYSYQFDKIQHLTVHQVGSRYRTILQPFYVYWKSKEDAREFVDALNTIKYYLSEQPIADDADAFADFQEKAKAWRALPVKPALPEAVRRFKTLAEDAIQNKNFEKAVDYYEQGLAVSPLWPEGQFNAALLCGELQMYGPAVLHMKRYLELSPDAKDAQAARDKVVIWEEKVRMMGTHGPGSGQAPDDRPSQSTPLQKRKIK